MNKPQVFCSKYKENLDALVKNPLAGGIGDLILNKVSKKAFNEWLELSMKIINEERLDLSEEKSQKRLFEAMISFLDLGDYVDNS